MVSCLLISQLAAKGSIGQLLVTIGKRAEERVNNE